MADEDIPSVPPQRGNLFQPGAEQRGAPGHQTTKDQSLVGAT